jgi:NitT/TauT family transport system substrate-binding protein
MAHRDELVAMAVLKLGQSCDSIDKAAPNVELTWNIDDAFLVAAKYHGTEKLERKQIREPSADDGAFINTRFVREVAK